MAQWNPQVNDLFLEARDFAASEGRRAFLACAGDAEHRAKVEALLQAGEQAGSSRGPACHLVNQVIVSRRAHDHLTPQDC